MSTAARSGVPRSPPRPQHSTAQQALLACNPSCPLLNAKPPLHARVHCSNSSATDPAVKPAASVNGAPAERPAGPAAPGAAWLCERHGVAARRLAAFALLVGSAGRSAAGLAAAPCSAAATSVPAASTAAAVPLPAAAQLAAAAAMTAAAAATRQVEAAPAAPAAPRQAEAAEAATAARAEVQDAVAETAVTTSWQRC